MELGRKGLIAEVSIAFLLGLFPLAVHTLLATFQYPSLVIRTGFALAFIANPGVFLGGLVGAVIDVAGLTTDWHWLSRVQNTVGVVANMMTFAVVWFALRACPRASLWRRGVVMTIAVWLVFMIPVAIYASLWVAF
jgi:hypothetical protein